MLSYFDDDDVEEVFVNGVHSVAGVRHGHHMGLPALEVPGETLVAAVQDFAFAEGRRLDPRMPSAGGILNPQGIRWHALIPPLTPAGALLSLRRHRFGQISLNNFQLTDCDQQAMADWISNRRGPVLVYGPTGSGKSSLLAAMLAAFCHDERLCIIEDIDELPQHSPLWIRATTAPAAIGQEAAWTLIQVFRDCLRMRPQRFIVGEIREREASVFLDAVTVGQYPPMATIHAGSAHGAWSRLCRLAQRAQFGSDLGTCEISDILMVSVNQRRAEILTGPKQYFTLRPRRRSPIRTYK